MQSMDLKIDPWDTSLLLPMIVSHTIDESSPLFGFTLKTMEALDAEIVVAFEGSTELGDMFQVMLLFHLRGRHVLFFKQREAEGAEMRSFP